MVKNLEESIAALEAARELLSDPKRWCRGFYALDAKQNSRSPIAPDACSWCAMGAVGNARGKDLLITPIPVLDRELMNFAARKLTHSRWRVAADVNDFGTHEEVLEMFDLAIAEGKRRMAEESKVAAA